MSVLMLAACPFPTGQGTQVLIRHQATALALAGFPIHLLTYSHGETGLSTTFPFTWHTAQSLHVSLRSGPSWGKLWADAALLSVAHPMVRQHKVTLLYAHHIEGLALGLILRQRFSLPLIYQAHTSLTDELPTYFHRPAAQSLARQAAHAVERLLPPLADAVVAFDDEHAQQLLHLGVKKERLCVIPPGLLAPEAHVMARGQAAKTTREQKRLAGLTTWDNGPHRYLKNGPCVVYTGNADTYQNLPLLWQSIQLVRQTLPSIKLLMLTSHEPTPFWKALAACGLDAISVVEHIQGPEELAKGLAAADVGVAPRVLPVGVPIKVLNYLAAGLPVVACRKAVHYLPTPTPAVCLAEPTAVSFAEAIVSLLQTPHPEHLKKEAKAAFLPFALEHQLPRYEALFSRFGVEREL